MAHARAPLQHAILHTLFLSPLRRLAVLQASHICKWMLSQGCLKQHFRASLFCRPDLSLMSMLSQVALLRWKVHHEAMLPQPRLGPPRAQVSHGSRPPAQGCCCPPSCQLLPGCKQPATQQTGASVRRGHHCCSHAFLRST